ncbi:hypothetical protein CVT25_011478 [Psilocybe cyanescens]|uniref:Uncharacterized protein n=1 Tax=Psilocybe cyanescens TaxID=93625 RepID=A0A409XA17_PSICY|nr:hypothetical protein CVT25_011478 [Psilocybe cyanescens]
MLSSRLCAHDLALQLVVDGDVVGLCQDGEPGRVQSAEKNTSSAVEENVSTNSLLFTTPVTAKQLFSVSPSANALAPLFAALISDISGAASTPTSSSSQQHHSRAGSYGGGGSSRGYAPHDERQEFSSAFGLMSPDDPNVIAGLAIDGQPFFLDLDHAHN